MRIPALRRWGSKRSGDRHMQHRSMQWALLVGGGIAGTLDILFAMAFAAYRGGVSPARVLQVVASGALGEAAFSGGLPAAALGLALHFLLSFAWAGQFLIAVMRLPALTRRPLLSGIAFGIIVFLMMRCVVLPLSRCLFRCPSSRSRRAWTCCRTCSCSACPSRSRHAGQRRKPREAGAPGPGGDDSGVTFEGAARRSHANLQALCYRHEQELPRRKNWLPHPAQPAGCGAVGEAGGGGSAGPHQGDGPRYRGARRTSVRGQVGLVLHLHGPSQRQPADPAYPLPGRYRRHPGHRVLENRFRTRRRNRWSVVPVSEIRAVRSV